MSIKKRITDEIHIIETRPGFIFPGGYSYNDLKYFLYGYLISLGEESSVSYGAMLNEWLSNKYGQSSLMHFEYVYRVLANKDEAKAKKILLEELKALIASIPETLEVYCLYNDERTEFEAIAKGWRNDIYVKSGSQYYHLNVYDIVRLKQDFETELEDYGIYNSDPNMVLVNEVSRDEIKRQVARLYENKYFEAIKQVSHKELEQLKLVLL